MKDTTNKLANTIDSPLVLRWDESTWQYKVNKPLNQSGQYVDKEIASQLAEENKMLLDVCKLNSMFPITTIKEQEIVYAFAQSLGWKMDCPVENWTIKFTIECIAKAEGRGE